MRSESISRPNLPGASALAAPVARFGWFTGLARHLLGSAMGRIGVACVALVLSFALFDTLIAPYDPIAIAPQARLQGPGLLHLLGTDQLGRDLLSRVIDGTRIVMGVVLASIGGGLTIGLVSGLLAGYGPRPIGAALMLIADTIISLPMMLFALAVAMIIGGGLGTVTLIVVIFLTPVYFRVVRSQTLALKGSDYVIAARAMGASPLRIMTRHILPNMIGPILVLITMDVPTVISIEAAFGFLGQGAGPPTPTWGSILRDGFAFIRQAPHIVIAGGLPILIATIGFTFLGEALRDALDPRMSSRRTGG